MGSVHVAGAARVYVDSTNQFDLCIGALGKTADELRANVTLKGLFPRSMRRYGDKCFSNRMRLAKLLLLQHIPTLVSVWRRCFLSIFCCSHVGRVVLNKWCSAGWQGAGEHVPPHRHFLAGIVNSYVWIWLTSCLQPSIYNISMSSVKCLAGIELFTVKFQSLLFIPVHIVCMPKYINIMTDGALPTAEA